MFYNNFGSPGVRADATAAKAHHRNGATRKKDFQHDFSIGYKHKLPHSLTKYKNNVANTVHNSLLHENISGFFYPSIETHIRFGRPRSDLVFLRWKENVRAICQNIVIYARLIRMEKSMLTNMLEMIIIFLAFFHSETCVRSTAPIAM